MSDSTANQDPEHIAQLRKDAEIGRSAPAEIQQRDRTIALLRAGVDEGTLLGKNIAAVLGDDLSPEAVTKAAAQVRSELGIPDPASSSPAASETSSSESAVSPGAPGSAEASFAAAGAALGAGAPASKEAQASPPLTERLADTYQNARRQGISEIQAQEAAIGELFRAGAEGDSDARYDESAFQREAVKHGHGAELAGYPDAR